MSNKRVIEINDIMDADRYAAVRDQRRREMIGLKKVRRLQVGPYITMLFENYDTMLYQVQEMLHTEGGGAEQMADELAVYNPLIPQGNALTVTMMIGIENKQTRATELARLGGIEEHCSLGIGGVQIQADWENDVDRTTPEGKTSAVHFLHFRMNQAQAQQFCDAKVEAYIACNHRHYKHIAGLPQQTRLALIEEM